MDFDSTLVLLKFLTFYTHDSKIYEATLDWAYS